MLGWFHASAEKFPSLLRTVREKRGRDPYRTPRVIANLRFPLDIGARRGCRCHASHRAVLDAECGARSTYYPPPPA